MMTRVRWSVAAFLIAVVWSGASGLAGAEAVASASADTMLPIQKPAWLIDLSLAVKESYDDNVYLAGAPLSEVPLTNAAPPNSASRTEESQFVGHNGISTGRSKLRSFGD